MKIMNSYTEKTKSRIGQARTIFNKMRNMLRSLHLQHSYNIEMLSFLGIAYGTHGNKWEGIGKNEKIK